MSRWVAYASGVMLLFAGFALQASASTLSDAQVRAFIASMPDIQALGERYPDLEDVDDDDDDIDMANPMSSGIAKLRGHEAYGPLTQIVKRHGFSSPEQWGQVGDRVIRALLAITMDESPSSSKAEMAEALKQIDENPNLSAEHKDELKKMMSGGMQMMQSVSEVPPADIKTVRPHLAELQRVMQFDGDDED